MPHGGSKTKTKPNEMISKRHICKFLSTSKKQQKQLMKPDEEELWLVRLSVEKFCGLENQKPCNHKKFKFQRQLWFFL